MSLKQLKRIQLGKESQLGTEVAATTYLAMEGDLVDESEIVYPPEDIGIIGGRGRAFVPKKDGTVDLPETPATFEQLPYLLNMGVKGVDGVKDGAGSGYVYTYALPYNAANAPYTYTAELGDNTQAEIMTACFVEELTIKGEAEGPWQMESTVRGWPGGPTTFTAGLSIPTVEEILFGKTGLYIDAADGTIGSNQVTDAFRSFELKISDYFSARWNGNASTDVFYSRIVMAPNPKIELKFTLDHGADAVAERAARRAKTPRLIRIEALGTALGTGATYDNKLVRIDLSGTYFEPEAWLEDDDGVNTVEFNFKNHFNATYNQRGSIVVVNELSALP
jgi:hypothetical protein